MAISENISINPAALIERTADFHRRAKALADEIMLTAEALPEDVYDPDSGRPRSPGAVLSGVRDELEAAAEQIRNSFDYLAPGPTPTTPTAVALTATFNCLYTRRKSREAA
jgi:hypothetical protein